MKRKGLAIACCAGVVSIALHAGGFASLSSESPKSLAGGPPQLAMIGHSFEDAVAGMVTSATDSAPSPSAERFTPLPEPVIRALASAAGTVEEVRPKASTTARTAVSVDTVAAPMLRNVAPVVSAEPAPISAVQPDAEATAHRPSAPEAAAPSAMARVTASDAPIVPTPDATGVRPVARPRLAQSEPSSQQRDTQASQAPQGTAVEATRAGDPAGATHGNATRSQQGQEGQSASVGRAAAQYPQLVNRHLSRLRRPNARFNGVAIVSFTIAETGGLVAVSVARSSGSAQFDRLALAHIQRAAPFPIPPAGAQRQFNVTIRSR